MICIQVPTSEINCPLKKSWKLRWRSERNIPGTRGWSSNFLSEELPSLWASDIRTNCTMLRWPRRFRLSRRLRTKLGGFGGPEQPSASAQDAAVRPDVLTEENFSLARL